MKTLPFISLPFVAFVALLVVPASGRAESILCSAGGFTLFGGKGLPGVSH